MTTIAWIVLAVSATTALGVDLVGGRRSSASALRAALVATAVWTLVGVAFAAVVWGLLGSGVAGHYLTVLALEKTLSLDNVAVFAALLAALAVPAERQSRVLTGGLLGALALRVAFIGFGLAAVSLLHPLLVVFGVLLLVAGARMLHSAQQGHSDTPEPPRVVRLLPRPVRDRPELLALSAVVLADVAFAADSILAAFAVTTAAYPIVAANVFAVLGLRPLYVVLVDAVERFRYLRPAIGVLLAAIGIELLVEEFVTVPGYATLGVVVLCLGGAVGASIAGEHGLTPRRLLRRVAVSFGGGLLLLAGTAMLVLPGPGLVVIVGGLALLATEYSWAKRPLDAMRRRLKQAKDRIRR